MIKQTILAIGLAFFARQSFAQQPTFEVASVKANVSGSQGGGMGPRADRLIGTNMSLRNLLNYAYSSSTNQLLASQIIGGPSWIDTDRFDVEAKYGEGARPPIDQVRAMLQSLLQERFQLKVHRDVRELPVFNLVLFKNGPKSSPDQIPPDTAQSYIDFRSSGDQAPPLPRGAMRMQTESTNTLLTGTAIPVSRVVMLLQGRSDRIILDKTGFAPLIDIRLEFSSDSGPAGDAGTNNPSSPSLFTAIQEIGLKLEPAKAPLDVLIVESAQRPSGN